MLIPAAEHFALWTYRATDMLQEGLTKEIRGGKGVGYDPIFIPDNYEITFAEMKPEEKNVISHRKNAMQKFLKFLEH